MKQTVRVVRRSEYVSMPWRNGGGVTFEIARSGSTLSDFDWRMSLALIERGGPFSNFERYQRAISLIAGEGCVLRGIREMPLRLETPGATILFPGSAPVECDLIGGPCQDLNLMVREPGRIMSATCATLNATDPFPLPASERIGVFCLENIVQCTGPQGQSLSLEKHDTLLVSDAEAGWSIRSAASAVRVLLHTWSLSR